MEQNAKSCVIIGDTSTDILYCGNELADSFKHLILDLGIMHFFNDKISFFQSIVNDRIALAKRFCNDNVTITYLMYKKLDPNTEITTFYNNLTQTFNNILNDENQTKKDKFVLPIGFDDCIYLPEKRMYIKNSIAYSAKRIAEMVDYVLVGTKVEDEGHKLTLEWANKLGKPIIKLSDICPKI